VTSVFTRIIRGELPAEVVHRDDRCISFLAINPLRRGHTLVVPIDEVDHWIDLPTDLAAHLMAVAHTIGAAQQRCFRPERVGLMIAGFEVPHTHLHVVPVWDMRDLDFANAAPSVTPDDLRSAADTLRAALGEGGSGTG
jgi:diadenosine tetraphosphate (Ap4A) HIT family hydrolase